MDRSSLPGGMTTRPIRPTIRPLAAIVVALSVAMPTAASAQSYINTNPSVTVDLSVLDEFQTPLSAPAPRLQPLPATIRPRFAQPLPLPVASRGLRPPPARQPVSRLHTEALPALGQGLSVDLAVATPRRTVSRPPTPPPPVPQERVRTAPLAQPPPPVAAPRPAPPPALATTAAVPPPPAPAARAAAPRPAAPAPRVVAAPPAPEPQPAAPPAPSTRTAAAPAPPPRPTAPAAPAAPAPPAAPQATAAPAPSATPPAPQPQTASLDPTGPDRDGQVRVGFEPESAKLLDNSATSLETLAERLGADAESRVQLLAYAAGSPENSSQARRLSLSRALAVRSFLIEKGVRSTRMDVRALGNKIGDGPADRVDIRLVQP